MEIATCRSCGKIFNHIRGQLICPTCQKELDGKFKDVKKFIYDNPHSSIPDITKACGVSTAQVNRWIREERLTFAEDSPIVIECESCGAGIKTGRFCERCKASLQGGLAQAAGLNQKPKQQDSRRRATENKMRFLDN